MTPVVIALVVAALVSVLVVLVARVATTMSAATDPIDRPGTDEQWTDLVDAMRRYRRHKLKARHRA